MMMLSGVALIKFVTVLGLAIWNLLEFWGLVKDFVGAQKMVGRIMNMELIEMPPLVQTHLMSRRVGKELWHKAGVCMLLLMNLAVALLLFTALYGFFSGEADASGNPLFLLWANYGLALFVLMGFGLSFVGLWFAYYIKQGDLMITHFVLIVLGMVSAGLINLP